VLSIYQIDSTLSTEGNAMSGDFEFEYGTWSVHHRRLLDRLAGCATWEEFDGTSTCAPILGGVGNLEEMSMPSTGTIGMALRLFDQTTRRWSIYWSTNLTGQLEPPVVGRFDRGVGVFEGDDQLRGEPIRVRFVWDEITASSARWTQSFRRVHDPDWEANWVMTFNR
jgi:hypothetical protein